MPGTIPTEMGLLTSLIFGMKSTVKRKPRMPSLTMIQCLQLPYSEFNRGGTMAYGFLSECGDGTDMCCLLLTFDNHPDFTAWNLTSSSNEIVMEGGNYASPKYALKTLVEETCLKEDKLLHIHNISLIWWVGAWWLHHLSKWRST